MENFLKALSIFLAEITSTPAPNFKPGTKNYSTLPHYAHKAPPPAGVNPDARFTEDMKGAWDEKPFKDIHFTLKGTQTKFSKVYELEILREMLATLPMPPGLTLRQNMEKSANEICDSVWRAMNRAYISGYNDGRINKDVSAIAGAIMAASAKIQPNFATGGQPFGVVNAFKAPDAPLYNYEKELVASGLGMSDKAIARVEKVLDEVFEKHDNYAARIAELSECFIKPQEFAYACFMLGAQNEREKNYPPGPEAFEPRQDKPQFPADMPLHVKQAITDFLEIAGDDLPAWMEAKILTGEIPVAIVKFG